MDPRPCFEWVITYRCNYQCAYCFQKKYARKDCTDETIYAVLELLPNLEGSWSIKLIGGEPFLHPRFFDICQEIVNSGHKLGLTTNFSPPLEKLQQLIDICGDRLELFAASLHLNQIRNLDDFIDKAVEFNERKNSATRFIVRSLVIEEYFPTLQNIERHLKSKGVSFGLQALLSPSVKHVKYSDEIEQYIADRLVKNTATIRNKNFFGTMCHTGELFFNIDIHGNVTRCYDIQPLFYLGNITKGTFTRFTEAKPCTARRCTCTVPVNRNMIRFGEKASNFTIATSCLQGVFAGLPWVISKVVEKLS